MSKAQRRGTVLVTGGAGYIGSHTLVDLLEGEWMWMSGEGFRATSKGD